MVATYLVSLLIILVFTRTRHAASLLIFKQMAPIFVCLGCIGGNAQLVGHAAILGRVVDEERFAERKRCLRRYHSEDVRIGFGKFHLVGEEDAVEEVVHRMSIVGKHMLARPLPMNVVGVAQQIHLILLAQLEQEVELIGRNRYQETIPSFVYSLIAQRLVGHLTNALAEAGGIDLSPFVQREETLLVAHIQEVGNIGQSQALEVIQATLAVEVDEHASKVNQQVLYLLIHRIIVSFV